MRLPPLKLFLLTIIFILSDRGICRGRNSLNLADEQASRAERTQRKLRKATKGLKLTSSLHSNICHSERRSFHRNLSQLGRFIENRHRLSQEAKLNICQQVTDAMTYLHDKNIVHAKLTSTNIYIEPNQRVKISLIDDDDKTIVSLNEVGNSSETKRRTVRFHLPALTYLSPELVQTVSVNSNGDAHIDIGRLSKESDVFSFGTLLFELFEERFPFSQRIEEVSCSHLESKQLVKPLNPDGGQWNSNIKLSAYELIYSIGIGLIEYENFYRDQANSRSPTLVKAIISACWSANPQVRPRFRHLHFA